VARRRERFVQAAVPRVASASPDDDPESLEVMMISARTDARILFDGLSAVVIDEVHSFAGDDRGAHLASLSRASGFFLRP